jgi:hypothetical protein
LNTHFCKGFLHFLQLERFDDRFDFLHGAADWSKTFEQCPCQMRQGIFYNSWRVRLVRILGERKTGQPKEFRHPARVSEESGRGWIFVKKHFPTVAKGRGTFHGGPAHRITS